MRQFFTATAALLLGLWGCNSSALPSEYREVLVPESRLASAEARRNGRELFLQYCSLCHGANGDGRGVRRNLSTRPQSFVNPAWRERSSPRSVFYAIREGKPGTAMAAWKALDPTQTWDLVAYILSVADSAGPSPPPGET